MFNLGEKEKKNSFPVKFCDIIQKNVKLSSFTSFKIGGNADIYIRPSSQDELAAALTFIHAERIPAILLGGGSNLLIPDEGIRGAVIHTCRLNKILLVESAGHLFVQAEAGSLVQDLTEFCAEHGLTGLEDFAGLPGTVGGAVFMNARCYEKSISDVLFSVSALYFSEKGCTLQEYNCRKEDWGYKQSPFQPSNKRYAAIDGNRPVIVSATFGVEQGDAILIRNIMESRITDRTSKGHFKLPSAGSVFKNNHAFGKPSGQLIDEAGLRGLRIGDAQVAPWHGNFIVNTGSATARDIVELIEAVQRQVKDRTGFELEPEIIFAG
ncbi:UDP-N-acetylenolpyruvoylglucosamine reductase [Treponema sp. OMZ 838]|uniref:UDP-N-acetylmuramate dehydrogenase n=1 Tax=Treponema sp. OMZ 838 TaxID=1539298 RepID=UPI00053011ED|nr:UDP-N-acetylmuramate dehydrogenase [Treponema sp. OMZ 838]AIW90108.1 UDP-N-acetylenolpyruvoylglucosamine reductase [Treponema sp. OMZ 838]